MRGKLTGARRVDTGIGNSVKHREELIGGAIHVPEQEVPKKRDQ